MTDRILRNQLVHSPRKHLGETFFSKAFASVTDQFGVPWMLDLDSE